MRNNKLFCVIVTSLLLVFSMTACGEKSVEENVVSSTGELVATETAVSKEENVEKTVENATTSVATEESTATESRATTETTENTVATEATEVESVTTATTNAEIAGLSADALAEHKILVKGVGEYEYNGAIERTNADYSTSSEYVTCGGTFDINVTDNGDGTKLVTANINERIYENNGSDIVYSSAYAFVMDRYTGKAYINYEPNVKEIFLITLPDGTEVELGVFYISYTDLENNIVQHTYYVEAPNDYDGLMFGIAGVETADAIYDIWGATMDLVDLPHGECDIVTFAE